jgi:transcriptional antiterminator RfaH
MPTKSGLKKSVKWVSQKARVMNQDSISQSDEAPAQSSPGAPDFWYLLYSKPRQEELLTTQLQQQGFGAYLPRFKKFNTKSPDQLAVFEPLFPRYVFFRPGSPTQSISAARSTRGASSLVRFGGTPAQVSDDVVQAIRLFEANRNSADLSEISPFQPGKQVRLRNSPLDGLTGLVQRVSSRRVAVLLELLGRPTLVEVDHQQLVLV